MLHSLLKLSNAFNYKSFLVFSDHENSILLALFDSNSNCYCNYLNGKLRFQINCNGGINFDSNGCCIRRWIWPNDEKLNTFHPMNFNIKPFFISPYLFDIIG